MLSDAVMMGVVLTLVFGAFVFYLYNRLSMAERKMGLVEGVLTDLKIMMDAAPFASGSYNHSHSDEFEPTPEYLNAISGPTPIEKDEVENVAPEDEYQQVMEKAMDVTSSSAQPYRTLQIDELGSTPAPGLTAINVTKLSPDLDSMTVKELQDLAKQNNVKVPAGTRRKDLIELLKGVNPLAELNSLAPSGTSVTNNIQGTLLAAAQLDGPAPPVEGSPL